MDTFDCRWNTKRREEFFKPTSNTEHRTLNIEFLPHRSLGCSMFDGFIG